MECPWMGQIGHGNAPGATANAMKEPQLVLHENFLTHCQRLKVTTVGGTLKNCIWCQCSVHFPHCTENTRRTVENMVMNQPVIAPSERSSNKWTWTYLSQRKTNVTCVFSMRRAIRTRKHMRSISNWSIWHAGKQRKQGKVCRRRVDCGFNSGSWISTVGSSTQGQCTVLQN